MATSIDRFTGTITGLGTASGTRIVIGDWTTSPFGRFTDVMIEDAAGQRRLLAPTDAGRAAPKSTVKT